MGQFCLFKNSIRHRIRIESIESTLPPRYICTINNQNEIGVVERHANVFHRDTLVKLISYTTYVKKKNPINNKQTIRHG